MNVKHDTHCSKCGGALMPVPSFTAMKWECPCASYKPSTKEILSSTRGTLRELIDSYGFGLQFRYLFYASGSPVAKQMLVTPRFMSTHTIYADVARPDGTPHSWDFPIDQPFWHDVYEIVNTT